MHSGTSVPAATNSSTGAPTSSGRVLGPVLGHLRRNRPLTHVDGTVERRSLLNDHLICAERSRPIDDAVDDNTGRTDVALDTRLFADGQGAATNRDGSINPPVDGQVLLAREFSGDDERGADDGHA